MLSPAAQHRERFAQATRAESMPDPGAPVQSTIDDAAGAAYRLQKIRLADDVRRLASIRSRDRANAIKRDLLPHYWGYCSATLSKPELRPDAIIIRVCIWCFDVGEISKGLLLAEYALASYLTKPDGYRHTLSPEGFKRNLAETLVESLADTVLKSQTPSEHAGRLSMLMELVKQHDMHDHIAAKMHRAYALSVSGTDQQAAIRHYTESLRLRPLASIRKTVARLEKQQEKKQ